MTLALACASHSPLMPDGPADAATRSAVAENFEKLGKIIEDFAPDLVIEFGPDHFNGFFYDMMPAFCVGAAAESIGDWNTRPGPLNVPEKTAVELSEYLLREGIDVALSYRMKVDHGFVQFWENTIGDASVLPLIPIFVNCAAPPLPTMRRARMLGEAVGRFAVSLDSRVLIVASGGLSHDPPTPQIATAATDVRERLITDRKPSAQERNSRETRVRAMGVTAAAGEASILPVSRQWDEEFLKKLTKGQTDVFDDMGADEIVQKAGRGGPEVMCWVAAMAAMRAAGPVETTLHGYADVQGWIAGMAILSGKSENLGVV
nr:3-carboxyethylcatechol 2,3-dioxygenase [uncultured Sphingorhabdus sp.]